MKEINKLSNIDFKDYNYKNNNYQIIYSNKLSENVYYNLKGIHYDDDLQKDIFNNYDFILYHLLKNKDIYNLADIILNRLNSVEKLSYENNNDDKQWILFSIVGLLVLVMQLFYIVL